MNPPRALLIDFGGTLDVPRHWLDRFLNHYRAAGVAIDRARLDCAFSHATQLGYASSAELRQAALDEIVGFLVHHQFDWLQRNPTQHNLEFASLSPSSRVMLERSICDGFVDESREATGSTRELLRDLHDRYRIAVVSNFYGNLRVILDECGFMDFIDAAVDSSAVGIFKPDPALFLIAMRELGIGPVDTAMVGDSLGKDLAPARRLGLRTVWLRHSLPGDRDGIEDRELAADYLIRSITDLRDLRW
ncbi:MAG: HAD family hydrolase [Candidatus Binataceae bacterium]|nr:HAD family hydrolase [Candidatus Binataceae bacterium]